MKHYEVCKALVSTALKGAMKSYQIHVRYDQQRRIAYAHYTWTESGTKSPLDKISHTESPDNTIGQNPDCHF